MLNRSTRNLRIGWLAKINIVPFVILICSCISFGQIEIRSQLPLGHYSVGFSRMLELDYSQNYPFLDDSGRGTAKCPKPLIINLWYPSIQTNRPHEKWNVYYDHFEIKDKSLEKWSNKYLDYTLSTAVSEWFKKNTQQLNDQEKSSLKLVLNHETWVIKDNTPRDGKFPLVIYHSGAGSSFDDNAIFCEWLASYGFVVVGCSFQADDGRLSPGSKEGSWRDIGFLLNWAQKFQFIDWQRSAMIGHSLGAQTMNYIAVQRHSPFDAMIFLESTQEYYFGDQDLWPFVNYVQEHSEDAKGNFLFASNPHAIHQLADGMKNATRYYLTLPDVDHNDFISQGIQRKFLNKELDREKQKVFVDANRKYSTLSKVILAFLNSNLKDQNKTWDSLILKSTQSKLGLEPHIEKALPGEPKPVKLAETGSLPTPRQLKTLIENKHIEEAIALLRKYHSIEPNAPIFNPTLVYALTDKLLSDGDTSDAKRLYGTYRVLLGEKKTNEQFMYFLELYKRFGIKDLTEKYAQKLIMLDRRNNKVVSK